MVNLWEHSDFPQFSSKGDWFVVPLCFSHQYTPRTSFFIMFSLQIIANFVQTTALTSSSWQSIAHNYTNNLFKVRHVQIGYKHTHTHTLTQRNQIMWRKVMSLASDQRKLSWSLQRWHDMGKTDRDEGREGGKDHMLRDVTGCAKIGRLPPATRRGVTLVCDQRGI